jgi:hypothetical protein
MPHAHESNKRRLRRLLREMLWNDWSTPLKRGDEPVAKDTGTQTPVGGRIHGIIGRSRAG